MPGIGAHISSRTILEVAQAAADNIGVARPTTLSDSVNLNDRRFLRASEGAMRDIAAQAPSELVREYSFYTMSGAQSYQLPADFGGFYTKAWNRTQLSECELSPAAVWQQNKSGIAATALASRYRIKAHSPAQGRFFVDPVPSANERFVFEYVSMAYFREGAPASGRDRQIYVSAHASGQEIQVAHATTSVSLPSIFLIGLSDNTDLASLEGIVFTVSSVTTSANGRSKAWLQGSDGRDLSTSASGTISYRQVMSYLDTSNAKLGTSAGPMFPTDLVQAAVEYRVRRAAGLPFLTEQIAFQDGLDSHIGRRQGPSILSLSGLGMGGAYNVPDGNFTT